MADDYGLVESVHAVFTGVDTAAGRQYRDEVRGWRTNDLVWRAELRAHQDATQRFRHEREQWRQQDLQQRALVNARVLWSRSLASSYRQVNETAEKLRTVSELGALVAGFAVLASLDFQYPPPQQTGVLLAFCLCTSLTILLELVAVVVCTVLLVALPRMARTVGQDDDEEAAFFAAAFAYANDPRPARRPPRPAMSVLVKWQATCEGPWRLAALAFLAGFPLFCFALALAGFLKFQSLPAALVGVAAPPLLALCYSMAANRDLLRVMLAPALPDTSAQAQASNELAALGKPFAWHAIPEDQQWLPSRSPAMVHDAEPGIASSSHMAATSVSVSIEGTSSLTRRTLSSEAQLASRFVSGGV